MSVKNRNMEVRKALREAIELAQERELVKEILQAEDVKQVWLEKKEEIGPQLQEFKRCMAPYLGEDVKNPKPPFKRVPEFVNEGNVVEFCVVLMMTEAIDDSDVVCEWAEIIRLLEKVKGEFKPLAEKLKNFLSSEDFTDHSEGELLEILIP